MPRIRPYESQVSAEAGIPAQQAQGSDFGGPGLANVGNAVQQVGSDVGVIQRVAQANQARREVMAAQTSLSQTGMEYAKYWQDTANSTDPKDYNSVTQKFLYGEGGTPDEPASGSLKHRLDGQRPYGDSPQALQAYDQGARNLIEHFTAQSLTLESQLAGAHVKQQAITQTDNYAAMAQTDPSAYEFILKASNESLDSAAYSGIPRAKVEEFKRLATNEISSGMVQGIINGPGASHAKYALDNLEQGTWNSVLTSEKKIALTNTARARIHAFEVEATRAEGELEKQRLAMARTKESSVFETMALHEYDATQPALSALDPNLAELGKLDPKYAISLLGVMHTRAKEHLDKPIHTGPGVKEAIFSRIYADPGDPRAITDETQLNNYYAVKKNLSYDDLKDLRQELSRSQNATEGIVGKGKAGFYKRVEPQITKPGPFGIYADPTTPEQMYRFITETDQLERDYRKAGKDPRELWDPNSPNYRGRPEIISQYQNKGFGSMRRTATPVEDNLVVQNPDRSQWDKRTDGSEKGDGFFGVLKRKDGKVSSELSTSDPIEKSGKDVLHPLIVPTLTRSELDYLLQDQPKNKDMEQLIYEKAAAHARMRVAAGKSPFAGPGEQQSPPDRPSLESIFGVKK